MTVPPLAHAGHWLAQIAYLAPLILLVGALLAGKLRARRERRRNEGVTPGRRPPAGRADRLRARTRVHLAARELAADRTGSAQGRP